jgi:phosphatidylglycerol:prolipoprotein diacylglycerol transferase
MGQWLTLPMILLGIGLLYAAKGKEKVAQP